MKKTLITLIVLAAIGFGYYSYVTRPLSAPSQDINTVSSKLPAGSATSSVYRISQNESRVDFTINEMLSGKPTLVLGTTTQIAGDIEVKNGNLHLGTMTISAKSFQTDNSKRNNALARMILKSEDPANEFITFKPTSGDFSGKNSDVTGDLTISGVTKSATFKVNATVTDSKITGTATTKIKRADYKLVIPELPFLANVDEEVPVTISLVANRIMQ